VQLTAIYLMSAFAGVGIGIVNPLIPLLLAASGASGSQVGLAATVMFAGLGSAALAAGQMTDRRGPKWGIVLGALVYAAALVLMPSANGFAAFLVIRALEGVGIGVLIVCLEAALNLIVAEKRRGRAMGTYSLVFAAGVALGPTLGVLFQTSVALPFWVASMVVALAGLFMMIAFRNPAFERKTGSLLYTGLFALIWGPILAALCYALVEVTLLSLYPLHLTHLGLEPVRVSLVYSIYASGAVVSPLIAGAVSDRFQRESVMVASGVLLILGTGLVWLSGTMGFIAIATAVMGLASGAIYPIGLAMIGDRTPVYQLGAANSLFTTAYSAGSILGPFSVGVLMDAYGPPVLFAPLMVVGLVFLIFAIADLVRSRATRLSA
jgi:MFS family permease